MAYFCVNSLAVSSCLPRFSLNALAISGTRGSSGLGSDNNDDMDNNTFCI